MVVYPGAGSHATYYGAGRVHHAAAAARRARRPRRAGLRARPVAGHAQPARPGRPRGVARADDQRPVRRLRAGRRRGRRAGAARGVEPDRDFRRRRLGRRIPGPVGARHRRPNGRRARPAPARSTPGPARSASRGTTRSASSSSRGSRRLRKPPRCSPPGSRSMRAERATVDAEAAELAERLPAAGIEVGALAGHAGIESFRTARQAALRADEARLAGMRSTSAQLAAGISAAEEYLARYRDGSARRPARPSRPRRDTRAAQRNPPSGVR